jgi:outer membrane phospholipase A
VAPKLTAGGSLFISSGTRPTSYYQPMAKLWVPMSKHVEAFAQWWFYGYGEAFYPYEGFGTHIAAIGLRYKR